MALADDALRSAFALEPDGGEAHLARAEKLFDTQLDYDTALSELRLARARLPNNARAFELLGYLERRQSKHEQALHSLWQASDLDPRNSFIIQQICNSYILLQRYAEAKASLDRILVFQPGDVETQAAKDWIDFEWTGDIEPLRRTVEKIRAGNSIPIARIADGMLLIALADRNSAAAQDAVAASGRNPVFNDEALHFSRAFVEGLIARMANDEGKARDAFTLAREQQEQIVQRQPGFSPPLAVLGLIDAALGHKEEALREGRRAVELTPVGKDALNGALAEKYLALIAAWSGEKELACQQLEAALRDRGTISYGYLKRLPLWDPLRGQPRFEKIVASLAPK